MQSEKTNVMNLDDPKLELPSIRYYGSLEDEDLITNLTCFQACLYYLLKTELNCDDDAIGEVFIRDLTFGIELTTAGLIHEICFLDTSINEFGFKNHYILGQGVKTLAEVEALLDQGKAVVIQTYMMRVPFFKDFKGFDYPLDEEYYKANYQWQHTFLAIAHDQDRLYYVEGPFNWNPEHYIPYPGNKTIGIIEKQQLIPAFNAYFNYSYLDIDMERMSDMFPVVQMVIDKTIANYSYPDQKSDKYTYYYGKAALNWMNAYFHSDSFDFLQWIPQHSIPLCDLLIWKTQFISNRRMMLAKAFTKHISHFNPSQVNPLIELLKGNVKMWRTIQINLIKMKVKKECKISYDLAELFNDVSRTEDEIIDGLQKLEFLAI
jgi:hypothetical protein